MPRSCLLLAALCVVAGCSSIPVENEVRAVIDLQRAAWNRGDLEAFMALGYWTSPELTFFSGGTWTRGYDETLARYRRRYEEGDAKMGRLAMKNLQILPLDDDHALARGSWHLRFPDSTETGGLFTLILERRSEGWRIVHDHTSVSE